MKLPEPAHYDFMNSRKYFTESQLIQALKDWSEECAVAFEEFNIHITTVAAAKAIREKAKELK